MKAEDVKIGMEVVIVDNSDIPLAKDTVCTVHEHKDSNKYTFLLKEKFSPIYNSCIAMCSQFEPYYDLESCDKEPKQKEVDTKEYIYLLKNCEKDICAYRNIDKINDEVLLRNKTRDLNTNSYFYAKKIEIK